ncbi:nucleoside-diphosphate kinase [Actinacidiphila soli]|uniref:nucleoside-diphosphate kinase n=1 Tax=Actinacidiphila soli TaxID=2487275 RepID=UPI000FCB567A|nr:nucleoside-diphosphate kinase [Actinacidiphila soli]
MAGLEFRGSRSDTWTYALATPDAVVSGALEFVFSRLKAHDLKPLVCRVVGLEAEKMQQFYGGNTFRISNPGSEDFQFSWDTHELLYGVAPASLIMLSCEDGSACAKMLNCKGHVRPELAERTTVRRLGENVIFNLVHSPDDTRAAVRELSIVLGSDEVEELVSASNATLKDTELAALTGVEALFDALPAFHGREATSFPSIARRIRLRIVMMLAVALHGDRSAVRELSRVRALLARQQQVLGACTATDERMLLAQRDNRAIHTSLIAAVVRWGRAPECLIFDLV